MSFEENRGQAAPAALFVSRGAGYTVEFERRAVRIHAGRAKVTLKMLGSDPAARIEGAEPQPGITNYLFGSNPKEWITHVPHYAQVRYRDIYPGIDLVFYGSGGHLEYDWLVRPGGDPNRIRTKFEGIRNMQINSGKDIVLNLGNAEMRWRKPVVFQEVEGARVPVNGRFAVTGKNQVGVAVDGFDRTKPLVIDPILEYATYLGGSQDDVAYSIVVDAQGDAYAAGYTFSTDFPQRNGRFANFDSVGYITKINPSGTQNLATTFIAGSDAVTPKLNVSVNAITLDSAGFVYIGGVASRSSNAIPFTQNAFQKTLNGVTNAWVAKLTADLSMIVYCSWLGGNGQDSVADGTNGIAVDSANNLYVTGYTSSMAASAANPNGFYVTANAVQPQNHGGETDGFLVKIDPSGSTRLYSTFYGGSGKDHPFGVGVDAQSIVYLTGHTTSCDFPLKNAYQSVHGGACTSQVANNADVFVTALKTDGTGYVYSTFLGGDNEDRGRAIYVDALGHAYVTGDTQSPTHDPVGFAQFCSQSAPNCQPFPTTANAFQPKAPRCSQQLTCFGGDADAFITELSPAGGLVYSTYYGGTKGVVPGCAPASNGGGCGFDKGLGILVQETGPDAGSIYIAGNTTSTDFPTANASQVNNAGGFDAFVAKIKPDGNGPLFSTYFGGVGDDYAYALARDGNFNLYSAGWATPTSNGVSFFPPAVTPCALVVQCSFGGLRDAFVFKLANADVSIMPAHFKLLTAGSKAPAGAFSMQSKIQGIGRQGALGNYSHSSDLQNSASSDDGDNAYMAAAISGPTTVDPQCSSSAGTCTITTAANGMCPLGLAGTTCAVVENIPTLPHGTAVHVTITGQINGGGPISFKLCGRTDTNDTNPTNNCVMDQFTADPNGCAIFVSSNTTTFTAAGGSGNFSVTSPCGLDWSTSNVPSWIAAPVQGGGGGPFTFTVLRNTSSMPRTANLSVSGTSLVINQAKATPGDFDNNGVPDIFLQFPDGSMGVWYMGGSGRQLPINSFAFLAGPSSGIKLVNVVDLNGDNIPDLILSFPDGSSGVWYMGGPQGRTITGFAFISGPITGWAPVGMADLDGDGHPDLMIQSSNGSLGVWYLGGPGGNQIQGFAPISGPLVGWKAVGAADLDGNGHPDVILRYTDGTLGVWYMTGAQGNQIQSFAVIAGASTWSVVGVSDMDSDGHPDLIIRNADGTLGVWYLGGAQGNLITGFTPITTPGNINWMEMGAH